MVAEGEWCQRSGEKAVVLAVERLRDWSVAERGRRKGENDVEDWSGWRLVIGGAEQVVSGWLVRWQIGRSGLRRRSMRRSMVRERLRSADWVTAALDTAINESNAFERARIVGGPNAGMQRQASTCTAYWLGLIVSGSDCERHGGEDGSGGYNVGGDGEVQALDGGGGDGERMAVGEVDGELCGEGKEWRGWKRKLRVGGSEKGGGSEGEEAEECGRYEGSDENEGK